MGIIISRKSHDCICNRDRVGGDEGNRTHYFNLIMPINTDFLFKRVGFRVGLSAQPSESVAACDTVIIQAVSPLI